MGLVFINEGPLMGVLNCLSADQHYKVGQDAFGNINGFQDRVIRQKAIIA